MVGRQLLGPALAAALLLAAPLAEPSVLAAKMAPDATIGSATAAAASDAVRFRSDFGLADDAASLASVRAAYAPSETWGVALTPTEEDLMNRRSAASAQLGALDAYGLAHVSTWGGVWITYPHGASIHHLMTVNVGTTTSPSSVRQQVRALIPSGVDLKVVQVSHTAAALDALTPVLVASSEFAGNGAAFVSAATMLDANVVEVDVSHASPQLRAVLAARYGDMVRVVEAGPVFEDSCSRTACGPPWRGGVKIARNGPAYCTLGFNVANYGGVWSYALFTAGHCGPVNATWRQGSTTGTVIGLSTQNHINDASRVDVQVIAPSSANTHSNQYIDGTSTCTTCTLRSITAVQGHNADHAGDAVCNHGYYSGTQCGKILSINYTYTGDPTGGSNPITLYHMREATYARHSGDSGGPVTAAANVAVGSHTDYVSGSGYAVYTHIYDMVQATGWNVYLGG